MPAMASAWAPPSTMAPFNPPPRAIAPSLTACVRRAPGTKGGASRFSEHFTSIHQRRNKSDSPLYLRQSWGWAPLVGSPPKKNLFLVGVGSHCVSGSFCKHGSWLFLPSTQDICIKMGLLSCKRSQEEAERGGGGGVAHPEGKGRKKKGSQIKTKKVSRQNSNHTLEFLLGK